VGVLVYRGQHRDPRTRHMKCSLAEHALEVRSRGHAGSLVQLLE
jgi:hypothetical protein